MYSVNEVFLFVNMKNIALNRFNREILRSLNIPVYALGFSVPT